MSVLNIRGQAPVNYYTIYYSQAFNVSKGLNTIYLANRTLFSNNSVIFYQSQDTKITLSASNQKKIDLIWNTKNNQLFLIDTTNYYKFNFKVFIENYVYENSVTINHVYELPSVYQIRANVFDINYCSLRAEVIIKKGMELKFFILYLYRLFIYIEFLFLKRYDLA